MKKTIFILIPFALMFKFSNAQTPISYTADNTNFENPERGFMHYSDTHTTSSYTPLSLSTLQSYRSQEKMSVIWRNFYMESFTNSAISSAYLDNIKQDLNIVRQAGFKVVMRFAYTSDGSSPYKDAPKSIVLQHISQLKQILQSNSDIILTLQSGFIGVWGEWYYSSYFGCACNGPLSAQNYKDRKEVLDSLLSVMPVTRMVLVRTPVQKATMYNLQMPKDTLTKNTAYNGSSLSRIGYYNDCFLVAADDYTYNDTTLEKPFTAGDSKYLAMGGETCGDNSTFTNCINAQKELARMHWCYLNVDYHKSVYDRWKSEGCYDVIANKLGYRYKLISGSFPTSVKQGQNLSFQLTMKNEGYARPINPRKAELVLRNTANQQEFKFDMNGNTDVRLWLPAPGSTAVLSINITIPQSLPQGQYELLLNLADPFPSLYNNPYYSIRLANTNTWESNSGYNKLSRNIQVDISTGIEENKDDFKLNLFPNPVKNSIHVSSNEPILSVDVFNIYGSLMMSKDIGKQESDVELSTLAQGVYILRFKINSTQFFRKISKE
ncbi:MAG: DUF4832 domain-containing protein [Bacteroidetes bacterium]|nr:DUF4832 domain-containing protein [Bacteroidota bacterium]